MITEISNTTAQSPPRGWVLYDGRCPICCGGARRLGGIVKRRGWRLVPLQRHWVRRRLGLNETELMSAMRILRPDGSTVAGADAYVHLAGEVGWARPLVWLAALPGGIGLLRRIYGWIAANRYCLSGACGLQGAGHSLRKQRGLTRVFAL